MTRKRIDFDEDWSVLVGELEQRVPRNTAKTGTAGGAADLTLEEGAVPPIPEMLAGLLDENTIKHMFNTAAALTPEWTSVRLPDDWTTRTAPTPPAEPTRAATFGDPGVSRGYLPTGPAWYRKVFDVPAEWDARRVSIDFDGVMRDAYVWVNGSFIGSHYSGYTGFSLDVSEFLRYGDEGHNVVLVRTDTSSTEGWWAEGGGIYRHAWLVVTDPVHVARHGVFVSTSALDAQSATVTIETEIDNDSSDTVDDLIVEHRITTPAGGTVTASSEPVRVDALGRTTVTQEVVIDDPATWSPDSPTLHHLVTGVRVGGALVDETPTTFGIRVVDYDGDGLLINGERTMIRGVCCHQDFAGVGIALPDRVHEHKIALLRELGCNAYRTGHHAPAPEILDACDRLGLLVLDENRRLETNADGLADLAELIRRDRNHPSVFMWCLENEEMITGTPMARRLLKRLVDVAHALDPTRLTTVAGQFAKDDPRYMSIPDVAGFNYDGGASGRYREAHPGAPVMATEDASFVSTRGVYDDQPDAGLCSSHDEGSFIARMAKANGVQLDAGTAGGAFATEFGRLAATWDNLTAHPYLGGAFVWTGFDYRGECVPFGWPAVNAPFGLMDLCGFPKDVYHYWRTRWSAEPVLHVFPHWNWPGLEGSALTVGAYTNCDEIELLVNGEVVMNDKAPPSGIVTEAVRYEPGTLEARGYRDGVLVATAVRATTGPPTGLVVVSTDTTCRAGGGDVVIVRIDIVDDAGRVVPTACPTLDVVADGGATVLGTGNGSSADILPGAARQRPAFNGHALAVVRSPRTPGPFTITVSSDGLDGASIGIEAVTPA